MVSKSLVGLVLVFISLGLQALSFFSTNGVVPKLSFGSNQGITVLDPNTMTAIWIGMSVLVGVTGTVILIKERKHLRLKL